MMRSLREVFNLGFFAGPPQVSVSPPDDDGNIDISLRVEERSTGQFRFGAGFSQLNSISGFLGVEEPNLLGRGQKLGLNWEFSSYRKNIDLRECYKVELIDDFHNHHCDVVIDPGTVLKSGQRPQHGIQ